MAGVGDDEALTQQPENTSSEEEDTDEEFVKLTMESHSRRRRRIRKIRKRTNTHV